MGFQIVEKPKGEWRQFGSYLIPLDETARGLFNNQPLLVGDTGELYKYHSGYELDTDIPFKEPPPFDIGIFRK